MAFSGELEHLHVVEIIQLLNSARKSGMLCVNGDRGESRIIFSNGFVVGANHLNNKIRIGEVLIKMKAITLDDLYQALELQKEARRDRRPLIATLIEMGRLRREVAAKALKKLIEITLVELIGWREGTFKLDTSAIFVSSECSYPISKMQQEIKLDAQMLLMDALRIYDERQRDRQAGRKVIDYEALYEEVVKPAGMAEKAERAPVITAEDLGLEDLDRLERKIPEFLPEDEVFDPDEIHRQKIREALKDFSFDEQEAFMAFLKKSVTGRVVPDATIKKDEQMKGLIFFSADELMRHSVMAIFNAQDVLVFAMDAYEELDRTTGQCLKIGVMPFLVFDDPGTGEGTVSRENIAGMRQQFRERYPTVPIIQLACFPDYSFTLQSFHDGIRTVIPRPSREYRKATFVPDAINFFETFKPHIESLFLEQTAEPATGMQSTIKERLLALRDVKEPSEVSLSLLKSVSETFERSIIFSVGPEGLSGEKAIGVYAEKNAGPTSVTRLKVPLSKPSVIRDVVEKSAFFFGESDDEVLRNYLFEAIGEPLSPTIMLLPIKSHGKTVILVYGDFDAKDPVAVQCDLFEILASGSGLVLENALYRRKLGSAMSS